MKARILVVEDHAQFRQAIHSILSRDGDLEVIAEAVDGLAAVQCAEELKPDLIVLDIGLPKLNGLEAARRIAHVAPASKIIFLTQESSVEVVRRAFHLRACGYVVKSDAENDLLPAIHAVLRGDTFLGLRFNEELRTDVLQGGARISLV